MPNRGTLAVLIALTCGAPVAGDEPARSIQDLAWIAGCWDGSGEDREVSEQWMRPSGGTMLGMSRTVAGGKTVSHEFLMIRQDEQGLHYVAQPSGQPQASFKLVKLGAREAVFENPEHDFPQRVIYLLAEEDQLAAAIEGTVNGQSRRIDFPMRRVACD